MKARDDAAIAAVLDRTRVEMMWRSLAPADRRRFAGSAGWIAVVSALLAVPLFTLLRIAVHSELLSYIPLVPLVTAYLLFTERTRLPRSYRTSPIGTVVLGTLGVAAIFSALALRATISLNDDIALLTLAYVALVAAGGFLFLGAQWMAAAAFPIAFLAFMIPLPDAAVNWLETALVLRSADVAAWLFALTGTPLIRDGVVFTLPTIVIKVAQECSGIHSSWVLFITSLLAAHLFLKGTWRRVLLVTFVIPLGILRNGFRILVIGLLCVHIGPQMIDSPIHHQGGPLFFALSLGPLFALLWWLRRQERPRVA